MGLFSRKQKDQGTPPVIPKYQNSEFHWVRLDFDNDSQAQQRTREYVHRQVADFRATKETPVRWLVERLKGGDVGLFVGSTMMLDVTAHELLVLMMRRAESMGAPLMLEGQYVWDVKAGPFSAYLFLPKNPQTVEMLTVS